MDLKILLFLLSASCLSARAQQHVYKHYTRQDGLPGNMVYCMSQDKDGFIWFGTENGASRFDGKTFVNFTTTEGLTDNEVLEIYSDKKGRTWFICFTGGLCYYFKGKIYTHAEDKNIPENLVLSKMAFSSFYEDKYGTIWFLAEKLWCYNENPNAIPQIPELDMYDYTTFFYVGVYKNKSDDDLAILISKKGDDNGILYTYDQKGVYKKVIYNIKSLLSAPLKSTVFRRYSVQDLKMFNFIGSTSILYKIRNDSMVRLFEKELPWKVTRAVYNSFNHTHILSTYNNGVLEVNNEFEPLHTELSNEKIAVAIVDKDTNRWFTTLGNGVFFRSKSNVKYLSKTDGLQSNDIKTIRQINGKIYLGFKEGIVQEYSNNTFKEPQVISDYYESFNNVRAILSNEKGHIFWGTDRSFSRQDKTGKLFYYNSGSGAFKDFSIVDDTVLLYVSHIGTFLVYPDGSRDTIMYRKRGTNIEADNDKGISHYIATTDSLFHLNNERKLSHVKAYDYKRYGRIADLKFLKNQTLFIASYNNGILYLHNDSVYSIDQKSGLISNQVRKLYIENDSILWALTSQGISKIMFRLSDHRAACTNYTQSDGFSSDMFTGIARLNDTIYLATDNGINLFSENQLSISPDHSVQITSFSVNNVSIELAQQNIQINYGDNIKIKFNGISYSSSDFLTYKYFLAGYNPKGFNTSFNEIELPALSPGSYSFKVYAINKNNLQSANAGALFFEVVPAWWQTVMFKLLASLIICICIYYAFKFRVKKVKDAEAEKTLINKQFAELKLEAVRSQMDPHFIFNCLNAIQHFNIREDYKSAQHFMAEFARLIRKTLNHSHRDFIVLGDEIELLEIYIKLEKLRFEDMFDFSITLSEPVKLQSGELLVPSLIFQPYVENAINHGLRFLKETKGHLHIQFTILNNRLIVIIEDNGIGINESKKIKSEKPSEKESFGINLTDSRIEVINKIHDWDITQSIKDKSQVNINENGTFVKISLPLKLK